LLSDIPYNSKKFYKIESSFLLHNKSTKKHIHKLYFLLGHNAKFRGPRLPIRKLLFIMANEFLVYAVQLNIRNKYSVCFPIEGLLSSCSTFITRNNNNNKIKIITYKIKKAKRTLITVIIIIIIIIIIVVVVVVK